MRATSTRASVPTQAVEQLKCHGFVNRDQQECHHGKIRTHSSAFALLDKIRSGAVFTGYFMLHLAMKGVWCSNTAGSHVCSGRKSQKQVKHLGGEGVYQHSITPI
jgi:hypothetical protein